MTYDEFLSQSNAYLKACNERLKSEFSISKYKRYDWDQWRGELVFSDDGVPKVSARIQFSGSISNRSGTWLWSWANPSDIRAMTTGSVRVREYGAKMGFERLTEAKWKADEVDGWEMTAVMAKVLEAEGGYRTPADFGFTYMVLTDVRKVTNQTAVFRTFTCRHVLEEKAPILAVFKEIDGDVQLLCGQEHETSDGCVIHLDHLLDGDKSLLELGDLPVDWMATREEAKGPWVRRKMDPP